MIDRLSTTLLMFALLDGCSSNAGHRLPAGMPQDYAQNAFVQRCAKELTPVSQVRGRLWRDAEHGLVTFDALRGSAKSPEFEAAGLEIAQGAPTRAMAKLHLRAPTMTIEADVIFDGWLLSQHRCPEMPHDFYFVGRFAKASLVSDD